MLYFYFLLWARQSFRFVPTCSSEWCSCCTANWTVSTKMPYSWTFESVRYCLGIVFSCQGLWWVLEEDRDSKSAPKDLVLSCLFGSQPRTIKAITSTSRQLKVVGHLLLSFHSHQFLSLGVLSPYSLHSLYASGLQGSHALDHQGLCNSVLLGHHAFLLVWEDWIWHISYSWHMPELSHWSVLFPGWPHNFSCQSGQFPSRSLKSWPQYRPSTQTMSPAWANPGLSTWILSPAWMCLSPSSRSVSCLDVPWSVHLCSLYWTVFAPDFDAPVDFC